MKNVFMITSMLMSLAPQLSFAAQSTTMPSQVTCTSDQFPTGIGSSIQLNLDKQGEPTGQAYFYLHDQAPSPSPNLSTDGWFTVSKPTFNEDDTTVNYYSWTGGGGFGQIGTDHLKLIPKSMVTYAFKENYKSDKTLFLGVISWVPGGKQELNYVFQCQ